MLSDPSHKTVRLSLGRIVYLVKSRFGRPCIIMQLYQDYLDWVNTPVDGRQYLLVEFTTGNNQVPMVWSANVISWYDTATILLGNNDHLMVDTYANKEIRTFARTLMYALRRTSVDLFNSSEMCGESLPQDMQVRFRALMNYYMVYGSNGPLCKSIMNAMINNCVDHYIGKYTNNQIKHLETWLSR